MNSLPLVSIIIPIYNLENYIAKCIDSIINQTYTNLEIILVNDGSTDSSSSICHSYSEKDSRIIVIDKNNGGISDARNSGMSISTGVFLSFIDGDDYVNSDYIFSLYHALTENDADISMCNYLKGTSEYIECNRSLPYDNSIKIMSGMEAYNKLLNGNTYFNYVVSWGKLYKKEIFNDIQFPVGHICEDAFVTYKLMYNSQKIVYLSSPLYYYVQRSGSILHSGFTPKRFDSIIGEKEHLEFSKLHNIFVPQSTKFYLFKFYYFVYEYRNHNPEDIEQFKKYKEEFLKEWKLNRKNLILKDKIKLFYLIYFSDAFMLTIKLKNRIKSLKH